MKKEEKLLLGIIYVSFIGLGIPDSLFGTAWPAIYTEFHLPISYASFVNVIVSCGTVFSSLISANLIKRFGTNKVTTFSTLLTAIGLIGFAFAPGLWVMCILAIVLGIGAGAIDVALNNYVSLHYSATHMSFLHCFYGIGVSISPYILSLVMSSSNGWRGGYRTTFFIQSAIFLLLLVTLPLWKKVESSKQDTYVPEMKTLSFREAIKIPGVKSMCLLFITSCAIECSCGNWGSTFLVEYKHLPAEYAAKIIMFYYIGIALSRFLSGILATKLHSWTIIQIGEVTLGIALILLLLPTSPMLSTLGMFLIGLGNGPLFPNFNYLTPENFGVHVSQSIMGVQMSSAYIGIMLAPMFCGILGQTFGMKIFPIYLLLFYCIMLPVTMKAKNLLKK